MNQETPPGENEYLLKSLRPITDPEERKSRSVGREKLAELLEKGPETRQKAIILLTQQNLGRKLSRKRKPRF